MVISGRNTPGLCIPFDIFEPATGVTVTICPGLPGNRSRRTRPFSRGKHTRHGVSFHSMKPVLFFHSHFTFHTFPTHPSNPPEHTLSKISIPAAKRLERGAPFIIPRICLSALKGGVKFRAFLSLLLLSLSFHPPYFPLRGYGKVTMAVLRELLRAGR